MTTRIDRDGNELQQITIWLPVALVRLLKADGINVSQFIREQIVLLYEDPTVSRKETRAKLERAAKEAIIRHRAAEAEKEAERKRSRSVIEAMRDRQDAARVRQGSIAGALDQIVGSKPIGRYARLLPENDHEGDRIDEWDALVRRVSRLCGAEIDPAEVAAGLRAVIAAEA